MKRSLLSAFLLSCALISCSKEELRVQVLRNPLIKFEIDSASWRSENYFFSGPTRAIVYPTDPTQPPALYNRFTLQSTGTDTRGRSLQLNIVFDAVDTNRLTGSYQVNYRAGKGLHEVQLYTIGSTLSSYELCANDTITPFLQIEKQSVSERLVAGSFEMTLCNTRDTMQKVRIRNGIISDIKY
jgi:hypothetical protein